MVSREMIQAERDHWSELPEESRSDLHDHMRSFLEQEIPPKERTFRRGGQTLDTIDYILQDLDSYG